MSGYILNNLADLRGEPHLNEKTLDSCHKHRASFKRLAELRRCIQHFLDHYSPPSSHTPISSDPEREYRQLQYNQLRSGQKLDEREAT